MTFGFKKSKLDGTEKIYGGELSALLPSEYSYKNFLPKAVNQGSNPICVPCSLSTYVNWKMNLADGVKTDNKMDYFSVYNSKTTDGDGMSFKEALDYVANSGVKTGKGIFKIKDYALVKNIAALRKAVVSNGPCVGALPVYDTGKESFWKSGTGCRDILGYHAISIVGYNKKGFILRNSWGSSYGEKGYAILPYDEFGQFVEIWTII